MEMRRLKGSDRELSALGYGAWVTGTDTSSRQIDADAVVRGIRAAVESGMNWIDTAELYAAGLSEELVGRAVAARRDDAFIATKVAPRGAGSGIRPADIERAIRGSLRRLGTDHVELYQLHWHDPDVPVEEGWGAMRRLVDEVLARFVGVSNFDRPLVERCLSVGRVDTVQNQFSLLHRDDRGTLLPWLEEVGISYLAYGSLAFGLLSGRISLHAGFPERDWRSGRPARYEANYYEELFTPGRREGHLAFARELGRVGEELGLPVSVVALRWVLEQPGVTAAVVGSLDPAHIRTNARAGRITLDRSNLDRIDELLARRYGTAGAATETDQRSRRS